MIYKRIDKVKRYCREPLENIENYEAAINDTENIWHCHHRLETDKGISRDELITLGLYYDRPASELIFLTKSEHHRIHIQGDKNYFHEHKFIGSDNRKARKVFQIDRITKRLVKVWNCVAEAARHIKRHDQGILDCCYGIQKTCGGFCWCYPEDYYELYCAKRALF